MKISLKRLCALGLVLASLNVGGSARAATASLQLGTEGKPIELQLTVSVSKVKYRKQVEIVTWSAQKNAGSPVEIVARGADGSRVTIATGELNGKGVLEATHRPAVNTTYQAIATEAADSTSNKGIVKVFAGISSAVSGHYGKDGGAKLFHAGDVAYLTCKVRPAHPGELVKFTSQVKIGKWTTTSVGEFPMSAAGTAIGALPVDASAVGFNFRLRCGYAGGDGNLGNETGWSYLKVTN